MSKIYCFHFVIICCYNFSIKEKGSYINIINLSKSFEDKEIITDINFDIKKSNFTVLLGPSGCGKTTILRMIAGLENVTKGQILLDNEDITDKHPSKRKISMVFQSYALFPHMSVKENIIFGLKVRKVDKNVTQKKLNRVVKLVNLEQVLDKKPSQLSGGQKQRVALARAFVSEHSFCLMDEPLSNLDAKLRQEMRIEIKKLQQELGITVLYVTHDQVEAMSMADHIILLNNGKIEQQGTPFELYKQPSTIFVAKFIGTPPMNIFKLAKNKEVTRREDSALRGIRPEDIIIRDSKRGVECSVLFQDYLGSDIVIGVKSDAIVSEKPFLVRDKVQKQYIPGEKIKISWDEKDIYIFDSQDKK